MRRIYPLAIALLLLPACKSEAPTPAEAPAPAAEKAPDPIKEAPAEPTAAVAPAASGEETGSESEPVEKAEAPPTNLEEAGFDKQVASLEKQFEAALEGRAMESKPPPPVDPNHWPRSCAGLDLNKHLKVEGLKGFCVPRDLIELAFTQGNRFTGMPASYSDDDPIAVLATPVATLGEISALTSAERKETRKSNWTRLHYMDLPLNTCADVPNEDLSGREMNCDFSVDRLHVGQDPSFNCDDGCEVRTSPWSPALLGERLATALTTIQSEEANHRLFVVFQILDGWRDRWPQAPAGAGSHTKIHGVISPLLLARVQCSAAPCAAENMSDIEVIISDNIDVLIENGPNRVRIRCTQPGECTAKNNSI